MLRRLCLLSKISMKMNSSCSPAPQAAWPSCWRLQQWPDRHSFIYDDLVVTDTVWVTTERSHHESFVSWEAPVLEQSSGPGLQLTNISVCYFFQLTYWFLVNRGGKLSCNCWTCKINKQVNHSAHKPVICFHLQERHIRHSALRQVYECECGQGHGDLIIHSQRPALIITLFVTNV